MKDLKKLSNVQKVIYLLVISSDKSRLTIKDICRSTYYFKSNVYTNLKILESKGYITLIKQHKIFILK
jgi:hypothetical protein